MIEFIIAFFLLISPVVVLGFICLIFGIISIGSILMYLRVRKENYDIWDENQNLKGENHDLDVESARVIERNYNLEVMITAMMNGQEVEFVYHDDLLEDEDFKAKKEHELN